MFEKIIVPVDFSQTSKEVVQCVSALRDFGAKKVLLLHSLGGQTAASLAFSYSTEKLKSNDDELAEIIKEHGLDAETRLKVGGNPRSHVNKITKEEGYNLITVGAQKQSAASSLLFGGLAYDIIHSSKIAVLILRMYPEDEEASCFRGIPCNLNAHILYPTDFSEAADKAYIKLKDMVASGIKKITLLHVQDETRKHEFSNEEIEKHNRVDLKRLEVMKEELEKISPEGSVEIQTKVSVGSPSDVTVKMTENEDIQLVVMGFHGRGFVNPLFIGGVSNNVARHADASVLLVP